MSTSRASAQFHKSERRKRHSGFLATHGLAAFFAITALLAAGSAARAQTMTTAAVNVARVDWRAAIDVLRSELVTQPELTDIFTFPAHRIVNTPRARRYPALAQLNALTGSAFAGIATSSIPVLLPFDVAAFAVDRTRPDAPSLSPARYQSGFGKALLFTAGPAGYDAMFNIERGAEPSLPRSVYAKPIEVEITGSRLTYAIKDPAGGKGSPVKSLASQYPDLRRFIREGYVRYAFTRFGVYYVVQIQCLDGARRTKRLACREAYPVAEHFLKNLRIVGGLPARALPSVAAMPVERPQAVSVDFTYRKPGELIEGTGYRGHGGHADWTAYAQIRFPIELAPAYANSQSFNNWGDCYHKGRRPRPHRRGDIYRCSVNDRKLVLDESAPPNYVYPWQDNFCETRDLEVWQCDGGYGHQGQDIRPSGCALRNEGADRCITNEYAIVAVRDGIILRSPTNQAAFLQVNTPTEHIRFRYMHMVPETMDAEGLVHGRHVTEGERIGVVSNYQEYNGGTTNHLHFDVQAFTPDGWIWVNPYVTLITAYERLLGARGREYVAPAPEEQPTTGGTPASAANADPAKTTR